MSFLNIAVIRFSSIGDIVLTLPAVHALKKKYPDSRMTFITKKIFSDLVVSDPAVDNVLVLDKGDSLSKLRKSIESYKFDLIVDLHDNLRSRFLTLGQKGIVKRYRKDRTKRLKYLWFKKRESVIPVWKRYCNALGWDVGNPDFRMTLPDTAISKVKTFLPDVPFLVIASGSTWATKEWPLKKYEELASALKNSTFPIVVIGGDKDKVVQETLRVVLGEERVISLAGQLSIVESAAVVSRATLLYTVDTGMMHIGSAFDVPSIVLFGSTVQEFGFFPASMNARVVERDVACRPCSHTGLKECPKGHHDCMNDITSDEIAQQILKHFEELGNA